MAINFRTMNNVSRATMGFSTVTAPLMFVILYSVLIYQEGSVIGDYLQDYILLTLSAIVSVILVITFLVKTKKRAFHQFKDTGIMVICDLPAILGLVIAVSHMAH